MTPMIERLADAVDTELNDSVIEYVNRDLPSAFEKAIVRAVHTAMMEPDEAMLAAAWEATGEASLAGDVDGINSAGWRAMLTAILEDK